MTFIQKHPLSIYFLLTFVISWGGMFGVSQTLHLTPEAFNELMPALVPFLLLGPMLSAVILTFWLDGSLKKLIAPFRQWRVPTRYWVVSIVLVPLAPVIAIPLLRMVAPETTTMLAQTEGKLGLIALAMGIGLFGGLAEEIGWTGFVANRSRHFSLWTIALTTGFIWGAWHLPTSYWGRTETIGDVPLWIYLPVVLFAFTVPIRVVNVWLFRRTASMYPPALLHASLVASVFFVLAPITAGWEHILYCLIQGLVFWVLVLGVISLDNRVAKESIA